MISRIYTVYESPQHATEYKGFDRNLETAKVVAVVQNEDVFEAWALDEHYTAKEEFARFIENENEAGCHYKLINYFYSSI